jgi:hypothetical protein
MKRQMIKGSTNTPRPSAKKPKGLTYEETIKKAFIKYCKERISEISPLAFSRIYQDLIKVFEK